MKPETLTAMLLASALLLTGCTGGSDAHTDGTTTTVSQTHTTPVTSESTTVSLTTQETTVTQEQTTTTTTSEQPQTTTPEPQPTEETAQAPLPPAATYSREFFDNDLFIGDSISTGLFLYGFTDKYNVFAEVGLNPESALTKAVDGVTCGEKVSAMQPRNIYIMLGTNGLAYLSGSYMASKMTELTALLEMACPTAKIYIITIPPVTAAHEAKGNETMALVNAYNSLLKELCAKGGYGCIDLCSELQDENGYLSSLYAEQDGLHFLGAAYIAMLNYVQQCAG